MSAQPVEHYEDPHDPQVILAALPERERPVFSKAYRDAAQAAAKDPAAYKRLQTVLHHWSIVARAMKKALQENPKYYEDLEAEVEGVRNGTIKTVPIEEVFPDWNEFVAGAHRRHYG